MNILFVCTANICRSVMAEGILKKVLTNSAGNQVLVVASAGIDALEDFTPDRNTVAVCAKRNVHIASHKARQLTKAILKDTDIVLCMEKMHKQRILSAFPKFAKHVFLLKEYMQQDAPHHASIEDPTGKSKTDYEACFKEIDQEIHRIAPLLLKEKI